jgi:hypothetical protein
VLWFCNDPRSMLKAREVQGPQHVLAAYTESGLRKYFNVVHEETLQTFDDYVYAGVELIGLDDMRDFPWYRGGRTVELLILANEVKPGGPLDRVKLIKELDPLGLGTVVGKWSDRGMEQLGRYVEAVDHKDLPQLLRATKRMLVLPTSGSEWATAKLWECYAAGIKPLVHHAYDGQRHIGGPAAYVHTADDVQQLLSRQVTITEVAAGRAHYDRAIANRPYLAEARRWLARLH